MISRVRVEHRAKISRSAIRHYVHGSWHNICINKKVRRLVFEKLMGWVTITISGWVMISIYSEALKCTASVSWSRFCVQKIVKAFLIRFTCIFRLRSYATKKFFHYLTSNPSPLQHRYQISPFLIFFLGMMVRMIKPIFNHDTKWSWSSFHAMGIFFNPV